MTEPAVSTVLEQNILVFRIRTGLNADLDPAFYLNADPDPGSQIHGVPDLDPG